MNDSNEMNKWLFILITCDNGQPNYFNGKRFKSSSKKK